MSLAAAGLRGACVAHVPLLATHAAAAHPGMALMLPLRRATMAPAQKKSKSADNINSKLALVMRSGKVRVAARWS